MTPWRAGCGESCTSGPEGGPGRPTGSDPGTAPRSHPYQFDQTRDGRMLKLLNVIDEHTRECLAIRVDRSIDADEVVATLDKMRHRGGGREGFDTVPSSSRTPWRTGAGSTAPGRCSSTRGRTPGVESFNGRLRDELLNGQLFDTLLDEDVGAGGGLTAVDTSGRAEESAAFGLDGPHQELGSPLATRPGRGPSHGEPLAIDGP